MAYFAPYIDESGLHIPSYLEIRDDLTEAFKRIYGQDIYLSADSQDYQMISAFALKTYDAMQLLQIIYNNRSPKTAVGTALDGLVKLNGIKRKAAGYSTCVLTLTAELGTRISNGVVEDEASEKWELPQLVEIREDPQRVTAVCRTLGAVEAMPGTINKIVTPTKGWLSVTNEVPAVVGAPVETDEELRYRQSLSVAIPSRALVDGAIGGVAGVDGVRRYKIYENDGSETDGNGIPGHSIAVVVEGGTDEAVAAQVYLRKGIGCGTFGDVAVEYLQSDGLANTVCFSRPEYVTVNVELKVRKMAGYTEETKTRMVERVKAYLESLDIGSDVVVSSVWAAALSVIATLARPSFSVQSVEIGKDAAAPASADLAMTYQQVARAGAIDVVEV